MSSALVRICAVILGTSLATSAQAASVFYGHDPLEAVTTNSDQARADWEAAVGTFGLDDLEGVIGPRTNRITPTGSVFSTANPILLTPIRDKGVISGRSLLLIESNQDVTWHLPEVSNSFGFSTFDHDGGTVTISFTNGTNQSFSLENVGSNAFWGIADLSTSVSSVTFRTTDPSNRSLWDNFVFGNSFTGQTDENALVAMPLNASFPLMLTALAGFGLWRRRRN